MSLTAARVTHSDRMRMCARVGGSAGDVMSVSAAAVDGDVMSVCARAGTARAVCMSAAAVDGDGVRMRAILRCRASP